MTENRITIFIETSHYVAGSITKDTSLQSEYFVEAERCGVCLDDIALAQVSLTGRSHNLLRLLQSPIFGLDKETAFVRYPELVIDTVLLQNAKPASQVEIPEADLDVDESTNPSELLSTWFERDSGDCEHPSNGNPRPDVLDYDFTKEATPQTIDTWDVSTWSSNRKKYVIFHAFLLTFGALNLFGIGAAHNVVIAYVWFLFIGLGMVYSQVNDVDVDKRNAAIARYLKLPNSGLTKTEEFTLRMIFAVLLVASSSWFLFVLYIVAQLANSSVIDVLEAAKDDRNE